ncbi:MAG: 16S rRNA (guanine(527)-N(7))-methyltransferase RsmG [SAR324 cluster bacterium]|nr:16S rRNA (guanine(527)-N(7))-methyltransferase RsmG [SAR324 cluster bacterium]
MHSPTASETRKILETNKIFLEDGQWSLLEKWVELLLETNQKLNLISRKDIGQIWGKHILHSLAILATERFEDNSEICDIGTGGGFPGIPLAIVYPGMKFTLMDSTQKKIKALQEMISVLGLHNVQAVAGRAEELGRSQRYRFRFSILIARAVAPLKTLEKWTRQLRSPQAVMYAYKGGDLAREVREASECSLIRRIDRTVLTIEGAPQFEENQKQIVCLHF